MARLDVHSIEDFDELLAAGYLPYTSLDLP